MDPASAPCQSRDILSRPGLAFLVFYLPAIAIVASGFFALSNIWRTILWTVALAVMGRACLVNALRCGRIHCYLTGPFFLVMALASLSYGLGLLPLGRNGWNLIGLVLLIGAFAFCCLPELLFGRYRQGGMVGGDHH